jgi:hypothetical protein
MEVFQKFVLYTAILVLLISLIFIGTSLSGAKNPTWPPTSPNCPDYWVAEGTGNDTKCINVKDLGTCKPTGGQKHQIMSFNDPTFIGSQGNCNKYTWASNCGVSWDGITYGVTNPCALPPPPA